MPRLTTQLLVGLIAALAATAAAAERNVVVNGERIDEATLRALEGPQPVVRDGRYWYDERSGLWGMEGGPSAGQIRPGLDLGGALSARASGAMVPVFVNGRMIHPTELQYLQGLFGVVLPGRYWLDARGVGGFEGGPPTFDLRAAATAAGRGARRSILGHSLTGSVIGGDGVVGYVHGGLGITCGPDGGCF